MKLLLSDLKQWAKGLSKDDINKLNKRLKETFEKDLYTDRISKRIKSIAESGTIKNLSEYKLLLDYFEETYTDVAKKDEIKKINALLEDYQRRNGKV